MQDDGPARNDNFRRRCGRNDACTGALKVDFDTAMLGGWLPFELFGAQVKLAVPQMTRAGKIITMEKAGLKNSKTGETGDLKFKVVIDLPASARQLRSEHKEILRA